ncbi:MAG: hypothetical protein EHM55_15300 [Acidobacteria bacterium]|nr:MAG: hypothetical protein EHM55_15300 [Acidobacteriota bacterium]
MAKRLRHGVEYASGIFGLLLILLVGKLANVAYRAQGARPQTARRFLARRAIDGVVAIGWLVDRLSGYAVPHAGDAPVATNRPVLTR